MDVSFVFEVGGDHYFDLDEAGCLPLVALGDGLGHEGTGDSERTGQGDASGLLRS